MWNAPGNWYNIMAKLIVNYYFYWQMSGVILCLTPFLSLGRFTEMWGCWDSCSKKMITYSDSKLCIIYPILHYLPPSLYISSFILVYSSSEFENDWKIVPQNILTRGKFWLSSYSSMRGLMRIHTLRNSLVQTCFIDILDFTYPIPGSCIPLFHTHSDFNFHFSLLTAPKTI